MNPKQLIYESGYTGIVAARHGAFLFNRNDLFIGRSLEAYGEWCEASVAVLLQSLRPGDTVVDVGANIGTHTVPLAKAVGAQGRVHALEPQRLVFQYLCANVALNALVNTHCLQQAAGAAAGGVRLPALDPGSRQNFGAVDITAFDTGEAVEVVTVDSLQLPACALIKIDVEGMEAQVLAGAAQTVARLRPLLFVENNRPDESEAIIRSVEEMGYRAWWLIANYFNPANWFGNATNIFPTVEPAADLFCVPAERDATVKGLEPVLGTGDTWRAAAERIVARQT